MNAIIVSAVLGVLMMFSSFLVKSKSAFKQIAVVGLLLLLIANVLDAKYGIVFFNVDTKGMLSFNTFGLFFNSIAIACTLIYVLLTGKEIERTGNYVAEYFTLIFFVLCGVSMLTAYANLLMLFLGIETLSIPLYILTGSDKKNLRGNEASLKYFLMGAFSTGIMLMGITLIYGATGSFDLESIHNVFGSTSGASFLEIMGLLLLFVSLCFKVSAVPFHFWTPDVYDGAPAVFTSFMATIVKAAAFVAFVKLFDEKMMRYNPALNWVDWRMLIALIIVATLLVGNITAVFQQRRSTPVCCRSTRTHRCGSRPRSGASSSPATDASSGPTHWTRTPRRSRSSSRPHEPPGRQGVRDHRRRRRDRRGDRGPVRGGRGDRGRGRPAAAHGRCAVDLGRPHLRGGGRLDVRRRPRAVRPDRRAVQQRRHLADRRCVGRSDRRSAPCLPVDEHLDLVGLAVELGEAALARIDVEPDGAVRIAGHAVGRRREAVSGGHLQGVKAPVFRSTCPA